jgi:hypothetical protein
VCGDGLGEAAESCDGTDLRSQDCESIGFMPGTLACNDSCGFDTSGCGESVSGCEGEGAGGANSECCVPLAEICDGQSNDCDDMVDEGDACPAGCAAKTFQGHLYLLCVHGTASLQKDYGDAVAECAGAQVELGLGVRMELARVESAPENDFVKTWIRGTTSSEGMVWFGANDIAQETRWVWGQGATATLFFEGNYRGGGQPYQGAFHDFPAGRPNSANITDEDCGALDSEVDWRWNDLLCTGRRLGFLCEQVGEGGAGTGGGGSGGVTGVGGINSGTGGWGTGAGARRGS